MLLHKIITSDDIVKILSDPLKFDWTVQGLGMMRTYLSDETRLHIWNPSLIVPRVSTVHDHPWDFTSTIICGKITNTRFTEISDDRSNWINDGNYILLRGQRIKCGVGGELDQESLTKYFLLKIETPEIYESGSSYKQKSFEIHSTKADPNTITIINRILGTHPDYARVFWPPKERFVSAEPRPATKEEIWSTTLSALKQLEKL